MENYLKLLDSSSKKLMKKLQASDFDKIIHTAFMVSLARQFTDIPYAKELAQLVEAQRLVELSGPQNQDKSVLLTARVEARYKAINQVMAQYQIAQVLELASGLLPRGLFMSCDPNIIFIRHLQNIKYVLNKRQ